MYTLKNTYFANCYGQQKFKAFQWKSTITQLYFSNNNTQLMNYIKYEKWSNTLNMFNKCSIQVNVAIVIIMQLYSNKKIKNEYINCYFNS